MQLFTFAADAGYTIWAHGSQGATLAPVLRATKPLRVDTIRLEPNGVLGFHEAAANQLLLVIQGGGTVSGDDLPPQQVRAGAAVFWQQGEWHETRAAAEGLTALIIEGADVDPAPHMPPLA